MLTETSNSGWVQNRKEDHSLEMTQGLRNTNFEVYNSGALELEIEKKETFHPFRHPPLYGIIKSMHY